MTSCSKTSAFTLVELAVVMAVLGVVAIAAASMTSGRRVTGGLVAQQESQHLVAALRNARMQAITQGTQVRIVPIRQGRRWEGFQTLADSHGVEQPEHHFSDQVTFECDANELVFLPTGMSDRSWTATMSTNSVTWEINVYLASGQARMERIR